MHCDELAKKIAKWSGRVLEETQNNAWETEHQRNYVGDCDVRKKKISGCVHETSFSNHRNKQRIADDSSNNHDNVERKK